MIRNAKWKPLELLLPRKIVNQKQYCISWGIAEIIATIKDLTDAGVGDFHHIPIQLVYLACEENRWILENHNGLSYA